MKFLWEVSCFWMTLLVLRTSSESVCDAELESTLEQLLNPDSNPTIQAQALRKELLNKLQQAIDRADFQEATKRTYSSLAAWNNLPSSNKRNLEALARAGYIKTLPDTPEEDSLNGNDANYKRSLAVLAKNGQLPSHGEENKRGIESLARNGELQRPRQNLQDLLVNLYAAKRNIGSLAKGFNLPSGYRFLQKKNVAALLRQDNYWNNRDSELSNDARTDLPDSSGDKRSLSSLKARFGNQMKRSPQEKSRTKRQVEYFADEGSEEYPVPVYQNQNVYDYEELMKELTGAYPNTDKRFLGRLPRLGKPKTTQSPRRNPYH